MRPSSSQFEPTTGTDGKAALAFLLNGPRD
jgi:hypothetical protein